MIAIAVQKLTCFLRLVLVAALVGYMLPAVSVAMHCDAAAGCQQETPVAGHHSAPVHETDGAVQGHCGDQAADHKSTSDQDCCSNSCLNLGLIGDAPQFRALEASPTRAYANDQDVFAEPIGLNRPPAFRA